MNPHGWHLHQVRSGSQTDILNVIVDYRHLTVGALAARERHEALIAASAHRRRGSSTRESPVTRFRHWLGRVIPARRARAASGRATVALAIAVTAGLAPASAAAVPGQAPAARPHAVHAPARAGTPTATGLTCFRFDRTRRSSPR